jgi:anti-sigma B factor antagonist
VAVLNIQKKQIEPDVTVLHISGRLTMGRACQDVEWHLEDLLKEQRTKVVFDLSDLKYLDSTGVGIVVMCSGKLRKSGGELRVAGAQGDVVATLKLTHVDQIVPLFPSCSEAVESFLAPPQSSLSN